MSVRHSNSTGRYEPNLIYDILLIVSIRGVDGGTVAWSGIGVGQGLVTISDAGLLHVDKRVSTLPRKMDG